MSTRFYDTDLTDAAWAFVAPVLPVAQRDKKNGEFVLPGCGKLICTRIYSFTANTAASLLRKGRRSSGHWERHSARCSASDSFVPVEP